MTMNATPAPLESVESVEPVVASVAKKQAATKKVSARKAVKPVTAKKTSAPRPAPKAAAVKAPPAKKSAVAVAPGKPAKKKPAKLKIVRDSFTMPEADFALIDRVKQRALEWRMPVKKSEVLRAALHALQGLSDAQLKKVLSGLTPIKKGRPKGA